MKNAYLAICYSCNERCSYCPCSKQEKQDKLITPLSDLKTAIAQFAVEGITDITISGGEPTLHPDFIDIIDYSQRCGLQVTVLSNGERFSNIDFLTKLQERLNMRQLRIITTLHSESAISHEQANDTPGSFQRSVNGLLNLCNCGSKVIVKHCITKENYKSLKEFFLFIDRTFIPDVDVQLCSIDYCGIPNELLNAEMLTFIELRPYLEAMFDYHMEHKESGLKRKLYCINMPLCACDPFYWDYIPKRRKQMYNLYKDPHSSNVNTANDIVGINETVCAGCKAASICCGTYHTAFQYFGSTIVKRYL